MKCTLSWFVAVSLSLSATHVGAAEATCSERLDKQERFTLTLAKENDILKGSAALYEAAKKAFTDNESVYQKRIKLADDLTGIYRGMWQESEKRATRAWYESPMLWTGVGIFATIVLVVGIGFTVKAIYDGRTQWQALSQ